MFSIAIAIAADCKHARFFSSIGMQTFWVVALTARYSVANASTGWDSWVNYPNRGKIAATGLARWRRKGYTATCQCPSR